MGIYGIPRPIKFRMRISIVTTTFNRANLLPRLFDSIKRQAYLDFEWLIIDDGSKDETKAVVSSCIQEAVVTIRYYHQENKGKHAGLNSAARLADGAVFFIVDSDDWLQPDALTIVAEQFVKIKGTTRLSGVSFPPQFTAKNNQAQPSFVEFIGNPIAIRYRERWQGDLVELFWTSVFREFPFPEIENERFCPEALVWNRISSHYDRLYVDQSFYSVEYQEDGLTDRIIKIRMTSPVASMLTYSELAGYDIPLLEKWKAILNFWRFSFNSKLPFGKKLGMIKRRNIVFIPLGFLLYLKDRSSLT
jgi:glycosyltransferase involved in cell wall biosynthesis